MNWAQEQRLRFIEERLAANSPVNRSDLMDKFRISVPQATADINAYKNKAPRNMVYCTTAKAYLSHAKFKPVFKDATQ
jgi:hypothetical protein